MTDKSKEIDYSALIRQLEEAGFEVRSSEFSDAPTMVFGNLDHAAKLLAALRPSSEGAEPVNEDVRHWEHHAKKLAQGIHDAAAKAGIINPNTNIKLSGPQLLMLLDNLADIATRHATPAPSAERSQDAKDAARYRWLRDSYWFAVGVAKTEPGATAFHYSGEKLDGIIDAALSGTQTTEGAESSGGA